MKNFFRNIFCLFLVLILSGACQSIQEGLTGSKKSNSDEFLVEKKNPLVLPPEFDKLPEPKTLISSNANQKEEIDLKSILTEGNSKTETTSTDSTASGSIEKTLLEKIKSN
jgi:hypothetical protein